MDIIVNELVLQIVPFAKKITLAILVAFIGFKLISLVTKKVNEKSNSSKIDPSLLSFLVSFVSISLKVLLIISLVSILGIPTSSIVALVASAGVAIGLAVQGALSNLVGGIMILFFRPFKVGDFIQTTDANGTVRDISVFYTVLITPDNRVITVPNGGLTNSIITNYSTEHLRRVDLEFFADYDSDTMVVKNTLLTVAKSIPQVLANPSPVAEVFEFGDNGIKYVLRVWSKNEDYWDVRFKLTESVRNAFKEKNINIPYPQMDVHIVKQ